MVTGKMFTESGRDRNGFANMGSPRKPYCQALPAMSRDPDDWFRFNEFIEGRGSNLHVAKINAWYPSREAGDAWLRVVIPATSRDQTNQFWQARLAEAHPTGEPRYQSPHAARGDALIVTHPERLDGDPAGTVLVEGPFDALAASELGFVGVALMGNTPSGEVLDHAAGWLKAAPPAVLVTDGDAVVQGADLTWRLISNHGLKSLLTLSPYPYKDLAEMPKEERRRMFLDGGVKV